MAVGPALSRLVLALGRLVMVALVCGLTAQARAQRPPSLVEQARAHFAAGVALFDVHNYGEALREFNIGYALSRRPRFLLNIGQTHRKLEQLDRARDAFRKFLDEAPRDDPDRPAAQALLAEVESELVARARPSPPVAAPVAVVVAPAPSPSPSRARPKRAWIWGVAVGGALLVGGAIALGVTLGGSPRYPSGLVVPVR